MEGRIITSKRCQHRVKRVWLFGKSKIKSFLCRRIKQKFNKIMSQQEYISKLSPHLFWDIDITKADMDTCPAQIIQRVLEYGQWEDWQLIRSYYGLDKIVSICKSLRTLDPKALAYICCISNTLKEEYRCYHTRLSNPTPWNY